METDSRTGSTVAVTTASVPAPVAAKDAPAPRMAKSANAGPIDPCDAGSCSEPNDRLVREPAEWSPRPDDSRFESPEFAGAAEGDLHAEGLSVFESPGFAADPSWQVGASCFESPGFASVVDGRRTDDSDAARCSTEVSRITEAPVPPDGARRGHPMPPHFPAVGETVGDFRLLASLGRGVRGAVFLADQPSLANRHVVLKITPRDGREHLSLAQLRHPHIVPLYSVQDLAGRGLRLLCMPYLGGTSLGQILNEMGNVPVGRRRGRDILAALDRAQDGASSLMAGQGPARPFLTRASYHQAVCWIGACVADALHFAHRRGLVHLDLKPTNILLASDATPMLLDFHLAQPPIRAGESASRWMGGTPHYMSPEQRAAMIEIREGRAITAAVNGRSDVYSLGLVLYQLLGGAISIGPYPNLRITFRRPSGVPVGLADIVARCLAFDPRDRYPDAALLAEDLRRHLADRAAPRRPQSQPGRARAEMVPTPPAWADPGGDDRRGLRRADPRDVADRRRRGEPASPPGRVPGRRGPRPDGGSPSRRGSPCPRRSPAPDRALLDPRVRRSAIPGRRPPARPGRAARPRPPRRARRRDPRAGRAHAIPVRGGPGASEALRPSNIASGGPGRRAAASWPSSVADWTRKSSGGFGRTSLTSESSGPTCAFDWPRDPRPMPGARPFKRWMRSSVSSVRAPCWRSSARLTPRLSA